MRAAVRKLAVFAVTGSLLIGLGLPFAASEQPFDADAHDGVPVPAEHARTQIESPRPAQSTGHCLICHWWSAMGTVLVRARISLATPGVRRADTVTAVESRHDRITIDHPSLRGPPATL